MEIERKTLPREAYALPHDSLCLIGTSSGRMSHAYESGELTGVSRPLYRSLYVYQLNSEFLLQYIHQRTEQASIEAKIFAQYDNTIPVIALATSSKYEWGKTYEPISIKRIIATFDIEEQNHATAAKMIEEYVEDNMGRIRRIVKDFAKPRQPHQE